MVEHVESHTVRSINCNTTEDVEILISESLRYLKDTAADPSLDIVWEKIKTGNAIVPKSSDFLWVITIPAIWDDSAKQTMRRCADRAGLCSQDDKDSLMFAYEPEAGAIQCIYEKSGNYSVDVGDTIMIFDIGGGTADFIAYRQLANGNLIDADLFHHLGFDADSTQYFVNVYAGGNDAIFEIPPTKAFNFARSWFEFTFSVAAIAGKTPMTPCARGAKSTSQDLPYKVIFKSHAHFLIFLKLAI
eukprot:gene8651-10150_t